MKKRINIILAVFAVTLFMVFSINVFSQDKQAQPEPKESKCETMMNDSAMMEECMSQMDSDMMNMCSKMMADMKEGSSMCNMMMEDKTDEQEIKGDQPEKENPSDESKKQNNIPENKG